MTRNERECAEPGCSTRPKARGLCTVHYGQRKRAGTLPPKAPPNPTHHRLTEVDWENKRAVCSICGPTAVKLVESRRFALCVTAQAQSRRRQKYGLSQDRLDQLEDAQDGKCAICTTDLNGAFHIDHDHACCPGARSCGSCVRGLLCPSCNWALGLFGDSASTLEAALRYLAAGPLVDEPLPPKVSIH